MKPRLLDLFCGAGGCSVGYHRAGFDVVGVDNRPMPRYPFEFHQADALEYLAEHGTEFDVIHASPPCQAYSITRHSHERSHPDLIGPVREILTAIGRPYVIENVEGAPLRDPITLCGTEFHLTAADTDGTQLELRRHRLFESSQFLYGAGGCSHRPVTHDVIAGAYGGGAVDPQSYRPVGSPWWVYPGRQRPTRTARHAVDDPGGDQPGHPTGLHRVHRRADHGPDQGRSSGMSQPVWEPLTHTRTCPWWTHGGICDCGVLDPKLSEGVAFEDLVAGIHDYVWEGDE